MLSGWVHKRRKFGGLIFIDLRDRYGITQVVFNPEKAQNYDVAESLKYEYVVKVEGEVVKRDKKTVNKELATGEVEVQAKTVEILSKAKALPFEIFEARKGEEEEELRLKYRYLELRRENLKNNILFRAKLVRHIRDYMDARAFLEIATPILTVSSPEGARDYLVPSRIHPGKFYALPQAPQQYKQLLMVAGFDRYYQIAPCMRDEDPRADRAPGEFYQLDVETSFLEKEEFFNLMEPLFVELTEKLAGKKVKEKPFPRIPFKTALETYGSDRPDLRYDLPLTDVTEWAKKTDFKVFKSAEYVRALVAPDHELFTRSALDGEFMDAATRAHAKGLAWMKYRDGKWDGPIAKFFNEKQLGRLLDVIPAKAGIQSGGRRGMDSRLRGNDKHDSVIFFIADKWEVSCKALGAIRELVAEKLELADPNVIAWAWIVDFPMYEKADEEKISATGGPATGWDFGHNPFSMPRGGLEALKTQDPLTIIAEQYDIIANGLELSSGAVRNKDPEIMYKAFEIAGYSKADVDRKFGHMIEAFQFGAPPHCGFAPGIERLVMLLLGEKNIRAVAAFPKNQKAEEPMMGSPSEVDEKQLKELHIKIT